MVSPRCRAMMASAEAPSTATTAQAAREMGLRIGAEFCGGGGPRSTRGGLDVTTFGGDGELPVRLAGARSPPRNAQPPELRLRQRLDAVADECPASRQVIAHD